MKRSTRWFLVLFALAVATGLIVVTVSSLGGDRSFARDQVVLSIDLSGSWPERDANASLNELLGVRVSTLRDLLDAIAAARDDEAIAAIELRVGELDVGWGKAQEIRDALESFRASGKPVHAFLEGGNDGSYFLASAADEVRMIETATLWLDGISAEVSFYGGTLEKAGLSADLEQIGDYKNAADVMKRKDMSPAHREAMDSLLDGLWTEVTAALAESLDRSPEEVEELVSKGPYTARQALDAGLIDALGYEDDAADALDDAIGGAHERIPLWRYSRQVAGSRGERTIAVIDCSGVIVSGESADGLVGGGQMGSDTIAQAIRDARQLPHVAAVVLRVDSPGGSPVASDVIWRETMRTKELGIPVVVSMSDVAASGGYWISMGADSVVAEPATITGSIGIYGGKYVVHDLLDKVAVHVEPMRRGAHAGINSSQAAFTDDEREWIKGQLQSVYRLFIERTAEGRGFESPDDVDRIARGRVWTGRQAHERGLVDELGGLDRAVDVAADLASLPPDAAVTLSWLPRSPTLVDMFFDGGPSSLLGKCVRAAVAREARASLPRAVVDALPDASILRALETEGIVAYMPFRILAK